VPPEDATLVVADEMALAAAGHDVRAAPPGAGHEAPVSAAPAQSLRPPAASAPDAVASNAPSSSRRVVLGATGAFLILIAAVLGSRLAIRSPPSAAPAGDPSPTALAASDASAPPVPGQPVDERAEAQPGPAAATASAAPILAAISVSSDPSGASVVVGGKLLGATPLRTSLPPGRTTVLVLKAGFEPWSREVALEAGGVQRLSARLENRASSAPAPLPADSTPTPPTVKTGDLVPVSDAVTPPRRISGPNPNVPSSVIGRGQSSAVVEFTVDESGSVTDPRIVESAGDVLDKACLDAVARWRYEPAVTQGVRVKVVQRATFRFERR